MEKIDLIDKYGIMFNVYDLIRGFYTHYNIGYKVLLK